MGREGWECVGGTIYAQTAEGVSELELVAAMRPLVPGLINADPDYYRTTRELVFVAGELTFCVSVGQKRNGAIWYAVMAVGATLAPPIEYETSSRRVGQAIVQAAADEGDFDE